MDINLLKSKIKTSWLGQSIHFFPETSSTNSRAMEAIGISAQRGEVFLTDFQTEGHGRLNHNWESPSGKNLLVSLIDTAPNHSSPHHLTLVAAVAFIEGILKICPNIQLGLKWPNDLMSHSKKLGGILTMLAPEKNLIVIGVGLNVNTSAADFSSEIKDIATSLLILNRKVISREEVLAACLNRYEAVRKQYDDEGLQSIINLWKKHNQILGKKVRIEETNQSYEGIAHDLDDDGFLLVKTDKGLERVISGDVILCS